MKRDEAGEFIYGHHASVEALKSKQEINKVWVQTGLQDKMRNEVLQFAKKRRLVVQQDPKTKLDELNDGGNHQGVVLSLAAFEYA